ncbi:MAG TPA: DUF692 domain-containing protein [Deltaproteobacteria bacterium]|nr:DUF692 domain-containing protein [Deltaproteobacteria bacterium]
MPPDAVADPHSTPRPRGVGIGLRPPHVRGLMDTERHLDFLEICPENYVGRGGFDAYHLAACRERWPILVHGVSVSLGGPDPLDTDYLAQLKELLHQLRVPFYTDHLCYTTVGGFQSHQLLPLPFNEEAVAHTAARIRRIRGLLGVPVAVENISYYAHMPGTEMLHADFVRAVCEEADCGLLLDVNNLFVNATNHGLEPLEQLGRLPLDRVYQVHIAGHTRQGCRLIDDHGAPTCPEVIAIYREVTRRLGSVPTLLERDTRIPPLDEVLDEADMIRAIQAEEVSA